MQRLLTQCTKKVVGTVVAVGVVVGIASVILQERFIIMKIYWLQCFVFSEKRRMSMVMKSSIPVTNSNRSFHGCFLVCRLRAYDSHSWTASFTSFPMCGQN